MDNNLAAPLENEFIEGTAVNVRFVLDTMLTLEVKHVNEEKSVQAESNLNYLSTLVALNQEVAWFLVEHYFFKIIEVSLPIIESMQTRMTVVKLVRKMCRHSGIANIMANKEQLITNFLLLLKFKDVKLQNEVFCLIQVVLWETDEDELINCWKSFTKTDFSKTVFSLLRNSTERYLLLTVLKCLEIMFNRCGKSPSKHVPFISDKFLCTNIIEPLNTALTELVIHQRVTYGKSDYEKIFHMCLNIIYFFIKLGSKRDRALGCELDAKNIVEIILNYYEDLIESRHKVNMHLVDFLKIVNVITTEFQLGKACVPDKFVTKLYNIWRVLHKSNKDDFVIIGPQFSPSNATEDIPKWKSLKEKLISTTVLCICNYIAGCSNMHFFEVFNYLGDDFIAIVTSVKNRRLLESIEKILEKNANMTDADIENELENA